MLTSSQAKIRNFRKEIAREQCLALTETAKKSTEKKADDFFWNPLNIPFYPYLTDTSRKAI